MVWNKVIHRGALWIGEVVDEAKFGRIFFWNNHSCYENILSPTNEMRFTGRKTLFTDRIPLLSIRSIRTDRHMAYTDRYGAGVLDNLLSGSLI